MSLRGAPSARVSIPQGTIYPSGIPLQGADPDAAASVRPEGWLFMQSVGYHTIRPGKSRYQDAHSGPGIDFTPMRFAEDISAYDSGKGLPPIISQDDAFLHADIAEIPGSQYLTSDGRISSADDVAANQGAKIGQGNQVAARFHDGRSDIHESLAYTHDMGDRRPDRPLTRGWIDSVLRNPVNAFRSEYAQHPLTAVAVAAFGVSLAYLIGRDLEGAFGRRGGGPAAAAPAATETAGRETARGGNAVAEVVEDAGKAVENVTKDIADAIS